MLRRSEVANYFVVGGFTLGRCYGIAASRRTNRKMDNKTRRYSFLYRRVSVIGRSLPSSLKIRERRFFQTAVKLLHIVLEKAIQPPQQRFFSYRWGVVLILCFYLFHFSQAFHKGHLTYTPIGNLRRDKANNSYYSTQYRNWDKRIGEHGIPHCIRGQ